MLYYILYYTIYYTVQLYIIIYIKYINIYNMLILSLKIMPYNCNS